MTDPLSKAAIERIRSLLAENHKAVGIMFDRLDVLALITECDRLLACKIDDARVQEIVDAIVCRQVIRGDEAETSMRCDEVLALVRRVADAENERDRLLADLAMYEQRLRG